ncbi:MAG TPA: DMT family transporter [Alphaproteobacteria bacterium]|nr:DMT family transporter [Alphaproteobacteria bacterium]
MPSGVLFACVAYALYSCCDAIIKGFGSSLSVHEIAFWTALFSFIPAIFLKAKGERWVDFWRMKRPWMVHLRSAAGLLGNMAVIFAFTTIPLAETYSLAFLAPIFIVVLSVVFLKEAVRWQRWLFLAMSFVGVLLVVRPGFRELQPGHLAAVGAALCGSIATTVLRHVAPDEKRVSLIGVPLGYILIANGLLMIPDVRLPTWQEFALLLTIGGLGGTGNVLFINATRTARASEIAPMQYSQIAWAITFGAVFFHEYPDLLAYAGLAVVVVFGVLNVMSDEVRIRIFSRLSFGLGPATMVAEASRPLRRSAKAPPASETGSATGTSTDERDAA